MKIKLIYKCYNFFSFFFKKKISESRPIFPKFSLLILKFYYQENKFFSIFYFRFLISCIFYTMTYSHKDFSVYKHIILFQVLTRFIQLMNDKQQIKQIQTIHSSINVRQDKIIKLVISNSVLMTMTRKMLQLILLKTMLHSSLTL